MQGTGHSAVPDLSENAFEPVKVLNHGVLSPAHVANQLSQIYLRPFPEGFVFSAESGKTKYFPIWEDLFGMSMY